MRSEFFLFVEPTNIIVYFQLIVILMMNIYEKLELKINENNADCLIR